MFLYRADVHRHTGTSFQCPVPTAHIHVIPADKGTQSGSDWQRYLSVRLVFRTISRQRLMHFHSNDYRPALRCISPVGQLIVHGSPTGTVSNRYLMSSFRKRIHPGLPADQYRNWHLSREWHKACRYKLHTGPSDFLARQEQMLASFPRERRIRVGYLASVSSLVLPAYALPPSPSCAAFLYPPDQCQWVKPQPYCCQQDNSKAASRRR